MKKILVVSDTHGDEINYINLIEKEKPDITIHAGDFCIKYDIIKKHFDYVVAGNNDFEGPEKLIFDIDGIKFKLTHGHEFGNYLFNKEKRDELIYDDAKESMVDVLISGHTHIENIVSKDGILMVNPGSITSPRNSLCRKSYAILYTNSNEIVNKKFEDIIKYLD